MILLRDIKLLDTGLKIILLKIMSNAAKIFDILATNERSI